MKGTQHDISFLSSVGQGSLISHACAPVSRTVYLFLSYSYRLPVICTVSLLFVPFTCYSYRLPVIRTVRLSLEPFPCCSYRLLVICTVFLLFVPFTRYSYRLPVIRTAYLLLCLVYGAFALFWYVVPDVHTKHV